MKIPSRVRDYSLEFIDGVFTHKEDVFSYGKIGRPFYFIDEQIFNLYKEKIIKFIGNDEFLLIPAVEENKTYSKLADYYRPLIEFGFRRGDVLVTFGGGILQDISGFIASTLYRGINWIFFPTTLLAQADSCIGSKTSINFEDSKNLIGTFYPPDLVVVDTNFCETLPPSYFNSGLGEIIKYHLMVDGEKYKLLKDYLSAGDLRAQKNLKPIIVSSLEIKKFYFEGDEFDTGRRNLLNYGHCFGHALESATQFGVSHGEAVIVGMGFANLLSLQRGILEQTLYKDIEAILRPHYPRINFEAVSVNTIVHFLKKDKKRVGNNLTMILMQEIGRHSKCDDVTEEEVRRCFKEFIVQYPKSQL